MEEVAERRSQAHNGSGCAPAHLKAVTSASGGRRRARDERAPTSHAASVGHGGIEDASSISVSDEELCAVVLSRARSLDCLTRR